jgi:hypothetical protein
MRRTVLVSEGEGALVIETGDVGTQVLDEAGMVVEEHGSDRHDELVAAREAAGWRVTERGDVRPPEAGAERRPPDGPAGPRGRWSRGR